MEEACTPWSSGCSNRNEPPQHCSTTVSSADRIVVTVCGHYVRQQLWSAWTGLDRRKPVTIYAEKRMPHAGCEDKMRDETGRDGTRRDGRWLPFSLFSASSVYRSLLHSSATSQAETTCIARHSRRRSRRPRIHPRGHTRSGCVYMAHSTTHDAR